MLAHIEAVVYRKLNSTDIGSEDRAYLYVVLWAATVFAALIHAGFLLLYLLLGMQALAWVNAGSLAVYLANYSLLKHRKTFTLCLAVITCEVCLYVILSTYFLSRGSNVITFLFMALVLQMMLGQIRFRTRLLMVVLLCLSSQCALLIEWSSSPASAGGDAEYLLAGIHLSICFFDIAVEVLTANYVRAITARYHERSRALLREQAMRDPLTGLFNRRYAEEGFSVMLAQNPSMECCVAMMDIDEFKQVNDTYGHAVGDTVLKELAGTVRGLLRKNDLVFRWGGEEFLIVLADVNLDMARTILEKVRKAVQEHELLVKGEAIRATATIGVVRLDPNRVQESIELCDQRMFEGKSSGKNRTVL